MNHEKSRQIKATFFPQPLPPSQAQHHSFIPDCSTIGPIVPQTAGGWGMRELWTFFEFLSAFLPLHAFFPAPARALQKPLFFQSISPCSCLGLCTGCCVNICSTVLLSVGCRGIPTPQKAHWEIPAFPFVYGYG